MDYSRAATVIQKKFREYAANDKDNPNLQSKLDEMQKAFIHPWCKRWRTKSIFQVLLLYRAEKLQNLVNFCIQIHIYNQQVLKNFQEINFEIDFEEIELNADPLEYLPSKKPNNYKVPFIWESFILQNSISNCQPLPECNLELLEFEVNNITNMKCNQNKTNTIVEVLALNKSKSYEDKETQVSLNFEESRRLSEKEEQKKRLHVKFSNKSEVREDSIGFQNSIPNESSKLALVLSDEKLVPKDICKNEYVSSENRTENSTSQKEYKKDDEKPDFRNKNSQPLILNHQQNFKNSLKEMEEKFYQRTCNENNDPPFNFRAILRKTNFSRNLDQNENEDFDFQSETKYSELEARQKTMTTITFKNLTSPQGITVTELAPGILIHGKIVDL